MKENLMLTFCNTLNGLAFEIPELEFGKIVMPHKLCFRSFSKYDMNQLIQIFKYYNNSFIAREYQNFGFILC